MQDSNVCVFVYVGDWIKRFFFHFVWIFVRKIKAHVCFCIGLLFHKIHKKKNAHNQNLHVEWAIQSERQKEKKKIEKVLEEDLDVPNNNSNNK